MRLSYGSALLCLFAVNCAVADDDPMARLRHVRSLRCTYTAEVTTAFRPDGRKVVEDHDVIVAVFDNIDLVHGTARVIYEKGVTPGAGDVSVRWNGNALWFTEVPESNAAVSNAVLTTVFARYASGTRDFIALDSRHSLAVIVMASTASGTCSELK
jgi:hypothetical protein